MAKKRKKCPFCGVEVNKENFDKHLLKVHKNLKKKDFEKKGLKKPVGAASKKKDQDEGKKVTRKRKPKKKDRVTPAISIITLVIIVALIGTVIYYNLNKNGDSNGDGNGNGGSKTIAIMTTTLGTITIELDKDNAPITAGNFINLTRSGFYNGIIFHRVIPNFVIQAGGFTADESQKNSNQIPWENTGLQNLKYSISMARSGNASSEYDSGTATSQFFINLVDNQESLDSPTYPYVVFGKVIEGYSVVGAIGQLPTGTNKGMQDWPNDPPIINSVVIED